MRSPSKPDTGAGKALSRRSVLTGLAATCVAASAKWSWATEIGGGPSFFADGPDAELYGAGENYPIKDGGGSTSPAIRPRQNTASAHSVITMRYSRRVTSIARPRPGHSRERRRRSATSTKETALRLRIIWRAIR